LLELEGLRVKSTKSESIADQTLIVILEEENVANQSISKAGKIAIMVAIIAGALSLSRAIYNYTQHGEVDIVKIALGIGIPCVMYVIVKSAASGK
jgi:hypothetical protein